MSLTVVLLTFNAVVPVKTNCLAEYVGLFFTCLDYLGVRLSKILSGGGTDLVLHSQKSQIRPPPPIELNLTYLERRSHPTQVSNPCLCSLLIFTICRSFMILRLVLKPRIVPPGISASLRQTGHRRTSGFLGV